MICTKCKQDKLESEFYRRTGREKRQKQIMPECKQCFQVRANDRAKRNRLILIEEFGNKCIICSYSKHLEILQFHHRDPSQKLFNIAKKSGYSLNKLRAEAIKCDLLCPTCHCEIHLLLRTGRDSNPRCGIHD